MPQRTFTQDDIINFVKVEDNHVDNTADIVASGTSFDTIQVSATDMASTSGVGVANIQSFGSVLYTGDFVFSSFPQIPEDSLIYSVKCRWIGTISITASCSTNGEGQIVTVIAQVYAGGPWFYPLDLFGNSVEWNEYIYAGGDSYTLDSSEAVFTFPDGMPYAEFVAEFGQMVMNVQIDMSCQPQSGTSTASNYNALFYMDQLELIVDYGEAPLPVNDAVLDTIEAKKGEKVSISSENGDLSEVESITITSPSGKIYIIPKIDFWYISPYQIIFYNPANEDGEAPIFINGPRIGTEFSGSVSLGTLTVIFEDTSGIYKIVRGKPTDTLYNPDRTGEVIVTKIPDPYAATGFIDG